MYLEKLSLHNYRGIRDMEIEFDRHLNVFVGDNGCGKTSILDALVRGVSAARINHVAGTERQNLENILLIASYEIMNDESYARYELSFSVQGKSVAVVSSSNPEEISSSLKEKFERLDHLERMFFPADRGFGFSAAPPSRDALNGVRNIDPRIALIMDRSSPFLYELLWIKNQEDRENAQLRRMIDSNEPLNSFKKNIKLKAVKQAISKITGFKNFAFYADEDAFSVVKKEGEHSLVVNQLSLGEQVYLGLIAAIATNVVLNAPDDINPIEHACLVLIDEIDLHLHPKWQRRIVPALRETFPNCQFIITTHSPQVLSEVPAENIFSLYRDENGDIQYEKPDMSKGLNSSEILQEVMDLPAFSPEFEEELSRIYTFIEEEKFDEAKELIEKYETEFGEVPALIKARTVLELSE
ncbi:AAA family ATPase [Maridesulfovibrio sp.]|uniref:AAA family ATPase n=1 Tax=Maridesulfovibrio sp. TaxID=2795000 RepID=UPI0039F0F731